MSNISKIEVQSKVIEEMLRVNKTLDNLIISLELIRKDIRNLEKRITELEKKC